jgi:hypothetical protein
MDGMDIFFYCYATGSLIFALVVLIWLKSD